MPKKHFCIYLLSILEHIHTTIFIMNRIFQLSSALLGVVLILSSCGRKNEVSRTTGWEYNSPEYGGFEKLDYEGQINGPNLVLIEGGTFTM